MKSLYLSKFILTQFLFKCHVLLFGILWSSQSVIFSSKYRAVHGLKVDVEIANGQNTLQGSTLLGTQTSATIPSLLAPTSLQGNISPLQPAQLVLQGNISPLQPAQVVLQGNISPLQSARPLQEITLGKSLARPAVSPSSSSSSVLEPSTSITTPSSPRVTHGYQPATRLLKTIRPRSGDAGQRWRQQLPDCISRERLHQQNSRLGAQTATLATEPTATAQRTYSRQSPRPVVSNGQQSSYQSPRQIVSNGQQSRQQFGLDRFEVASIRQQINPGVAHTRHKVLTPKLPTKQIEPDSTQQVTDIGTQPSVQAVAEQLGDLSIATSSSAPTRIVSSTDPTNLREKEKPTTEIAQKPTGKKMSKLTRVYFLRHAESGNNASEGGTRNADPGITEKGHKQALSAAQYPSLYEHYNLKSIFISPMRRTLETARPILDQFYKKFSSNTEVLQNLKVAIIPSLCENGGVFDGDRKLTEEERKSAFPGRPTEGLTRAAILNMLTNNGQVKGIEKGFIFDTLDETSSVIHPDSATNGDIRVDFIGGFDNLGKEVNGELGCEEKTGWWKGGRETDAEYNARTNKIAEWLWTLEGNTLLITHGKFMDGLLKVLLGIPYPVKPDDGNIIVFTGGAALTCLEFDHTRKRIGICFMNQPIIAEKEIRTGHKNMGGAFKNEW